MQVNKAESDRFMSLLREEWARFRKARGWVIGMLIAALLTLLPGLLIAAGSICQGPDGTVCPAPPVGPGGQAVDDRFYFVHQALTGDGSLTVRLTSMSGIITYPPPNHNEIVSGLVPWAKAGILIKESLEQGSAYAAVMLTGSHGVRMQYNFTEDVAGQPGEISAETPRWLRLTRTSDTLTGYESTDGKQWTEIGTARLAGSPATVQIGLFVTSPCDLTVSQGACRFTQASADFDQVSLEGDVSGEWGQTDMGDTPEMTDWERYHRPNGLIESGETFTVTGTGDIAPLTVGWTIERTLMGIVLGLIPVIIVAAQFGASADRRCLPQRNEVVSGQHLTARAIVIGIVTFVAGLAAASLAVLIGKALLLSNGNAILVVAPLTQLRVIFGSAALLAVIAVFALALGALFRRSLPAILLAIVAILLPLVISFAIPLAAPAWLLRLTPAAGFAIQQSVPEYPHVIGLYVPLAGYYPLSPWAGFAVLCVYTAFVLSLSVALRRQDK